MEFTLKLKEKGKVIYFNQQHSLKEKPFTALLFLATLLSASIIVLIAGFVFSEGYPVLKNGLVKMITGTKWYPLEGVYGILPMIFGSIMVSLGALLIGIPLGLGTAIFLSEMAPPKIADLVRPALQVLAGIPSVVFGFFGMTVVVPLISNTLGGSGYSALSGSLVLGIMILPTIINLAEDSIRSVPKELKEGSFALGATHWQTISKVILPAASSGLLTAIILALGRAIGEAMAVMMVTGNTPLLPTAETNYSLLKPLLIWLQPVRTLTSNIAIEMGYASGEHASALFACGIILFVLIMVINAAATLFIKKKVSR